MQLESLMVFCDVARCKSFSQAAQARGLTQSAASQIVSQLEKRLGTELINRSTRPLQLTNSGQVYYDGCKELIEQYLELEASIKNAESQIATTVQVAAIYSVGLGDMGQLVEQFSQKHPNVKIHVEYLHPDRVLEKVLDGSADLGLMSYPRRFREIEVIPWRDEEMVLACPPDHSLARERAIDPAALSGERYVGFDRGLVIRREVDRYLRDHGAAVDVTVEFDNIENIKKAVEVHVGIALLPEPTLRKEVRAGSLMAIPLSGEKLYRPLAVIHRRSPRPSATALRFVDLLRPVLVKNQLDSARGTANGSDAEPEPRQPATKRSRNGSAHASQRV